MARVGAVTVWELGLNASGAPCARRVDAAELGRRDAAGQIAVVHVFTGEEFDEVIAAATVRAQRQTN